MRPVAWHCRRSSRRRCCEARPRQAPRRASPRSRAAGARASALAVPRADELESGKEICCHRIVAEVAIAQQEHIKARVIAAPNAARVAHSVQHRAERNPMQVAAQTSLVAATRSMGLAAPMDRMCTRSRRL